MVDLEQFREAVEALLPFAQHDDSCGDHDAYNNASIPSCGCGLDGARDRLLSIIDAGKCPCGESACTESWEPGCGLGESIEHAVPAEREPPRGDELRAILANQPAPVVDDACNWRQQDEDGDHISTGCGHEFILNDSGDYEDGRPVFPFCCYCSKPTMFHRWRDEPECSCDHSDGDAPECEGCADRRNRAALARAQGVGNG